MARRYRFFLGFQSIVRRLYGKFFLLHPGPDKSRSKELNIADPRVVRGEEHLLDLVADVDLAEECGLEIRERDRGGMVFVGAAAAALRLKRLRRRQERKPQMRVSGGGAQRR
jgi:hypothetical protein